ncbi:hypothetical protein ICE98_02959 [Lactococcus lactis]|nr:hypothetical protein [Lactococcus lactis]
MILTMLWRPLKGDEKNELKSLLEIVSDTLREEADKVGRDLDVMISEKPSYFFKCL